MTQQHQHHSKIMTNKHTRNVAFCCMALNVILSSSFIAEPGDGPIGYFFQKQFMTLKIKTKLSIKRTGADDPFLENLSKCHPEFYKDQLGKRGYYLEDLKKINQISIAEYVFKDTIAANIAYRNIFAYSESTRKLARSEFGSNCFPLPKPQVYYASIKSTHVFLYTSYYNFVYNSAVESVETNIKNDKKILLDDLYREMTAPK